MKRKTLILPAVSSLSVIQIFHNTVICLPFLDFLCHLKYRVKQHVNEREKFHVIYYLIFVKNKSEFLLVLYLKFDMNASEKHS